MKQSGNTIQNANLQEFIDSAANAIEQGQRQFYTPAAVAEALFRPLPAIRKTLIADLHFGNGSLAAASGAETALGLDIDARIKSLRPGGSEIGDRGSKIEDAKAPRGSSLHPQSTILNPQSSTQWILEQADLTRWYNVAAEADLRLPFITINPPFSLQWHTDRLSALADSSIPEVAACYRTQGEHIDSTLASFLIALDRLAPHGEGFMVCNGNTARRFFGEPSDIGHGKLDIEESESTSPSSPNIKSPISNLHSPSSPNIKSPISNVLSKFIWLWLEIPAMIFDNQLTPFPTAVLYFSRSHSSSSIHNPQSPILYLKSATGDPSSIERALMVPEVFTAHQGSRYKYEHEFNPHGTIEKFKAINREYAVRFKGRKPDWNIALDDKGRLHTYLTPFQEISKRIPPQTVARLHALHLKTPVSLCVTATSRTALREAAECGIWLIQPEVHAAIAAAMADFDAAGAPFFTPNSVQSLGWVDEYSALTCREAGIGAAKPGDSCPITCTIEPTAWEGKKINLAGEPEDLEYTGKELLVKLTDPADCEHHFHVRRDDATTEPATDRTGKVRRMHWHIADLIEHFHIPIPKDITTLQPEKFQQNLAMLHTLEARVNANLLVAGTTSPRPVVGTTCPNSSPTKRRTA